VKRSSRTEAFDELSLTSSFRSTFVTSPAACGHRAGLQGRP